MFTNDIKALGYELIFFVLLFSFIFSLVGVVTVIIIRDAGDAKPLAIPTTETLLINHDDMDIPKIKDNDRYVPYEVEEYN